MKNLVAQKAGDVESSTLVFTQKDVKQWQERNKMKLLPSSEWHEDLHASVFVSFGRDENGVIQGEPPELYFGSGYLEENFDFDRWTHFIDGDFNFMFSDADPINFPPDED